MDVRDIDSICPKLRKFVKEVANSRPGISFNPVKIRNLKSSRNSAALCGSTSRNDRFSLVIPYCEEELVWDVIFLCDRPELPPDFYFHECNFLEDADCHFLEEKIPSLGNWNHNDPKALLKVLLEFLDIYKYYQHSLVPEHHRAYTEIRLLLDSDMKNDLEIIKENDSIHALICVNPGVLKSADDEFKIVLSLNFDLRYDRVRSNIKSYGEHRFWDPYDDAELPNFYSNKNLLLDFLPEVKEKIDAIVISKLRKIALRKQLLFQFYVTFKSAAVEVDTITYSFIVFSLCKDNFKFLVKIDLPKNFPHDAPLYKLLSIYCFKDLNNYERVEQIVQNVKYHQNMSAAEVVDNFYERFLVVFNNFKKTSISTLQTNLSALQM